MKTLKLSGNMVVISTAKCKMCNGTGQDEAHKTLDSEFVACEHCAGYGTEPNADEDLERNS